MKLFDGISDSDEEEEIRIRTEETSTNTGNQRNESRLIQEVEDEVVDKKSSSESKGSSTLPGVDYGSSDSSETNSSNSLGRSKNRSSKVDLDDIHSQNKEIIGLLKDIKSEVGDGNQLL